MDCNHLNSRGDSAPVARQTADEIGDAVRLAVSSMQTTRYSHERRRDRRFPFPHPMRLTPLPPQGSLPDHREIVVIGKSITERGLDFYHLEPVPYRSAIVWLPCGPEKWVGLAIELTWCRFSGYGWYENGGQFTRSMPPLRDGWDLASHACTAV